MPDFFHGARVKYLASASRPIATGEADVIFLVGTAQAGPVNVVTRCVSDVDDAQFLPPAQTAEATGHTIMQALRAIRWQLPNAQVLVVNVKDAGWTDALAASKVIGGISPSGVRTGLALMDEVFSKFGIKPTIVICPGFCPLNSVASEMTARASKVRGVAIIDAPIGTSPAVAIAGRGPTGVINFQINNYRAILTYPHVFAYDKAANASVLQPLSQFLAGVMAATAANRGVHHSASNQAIVGIDRLERNLSADAEDANCDVSQLNAVGIVTVFNAFGTGFLTWGNSGSNFPVAQSAERFTCCIRVRDRMADALLKFAFPHTDAPATAAMRDSIMRQMDLMLQTKVSEGKLIFGRCFLDPAKNTPQALATSGWAVYTLQIIPVVPNEATEFEIEFVDDITITKRG